MSTDLTCQDTDYAQHIQYPNHRRCDETAEAEIEERAEETRLLL